MFRQKHRITSALLTFVMLISAAALPVAAVSLSGSDQSKIDSYRSQQNELDGKIAEEQKKVDALKGDIAKEKEYLAELQTQIANYQSKIDVLTDSITVLENQKAEINVKIDKLNDEINSIKKDINHNRMQAVDAQHEITDIKASLSDSLRDVYVGGSSSDLAYLFASSDFAGFLIMQEISSNKAERDKQIISDINEDIQKIDELNKRNEVLIEELNGKIEEHEAEIARLNANEEQLEAQKGELETAQNAVKELEDETVAKIRSLDAESDLYKRTIANYEAQQAALDNKIDAIIAAAQAEAARRANGNATVGNGSYSYNGSFIWPLQYSDAYISSSYGYRTSPLTGSYSLHGGVDTCCYSGTLGKNVVAAAGGTVIYSSFNGYGNCVIVDHGSGYVTLYGHLNSRAVSVGQSVAQGQTIGYAGNTYGPGGYSTGPHLHFELRVNGSKVNPLGYCSP